MDGRMGRSERDSASDRVTPTEGALVGKTVVVTGASDGIGKAAVRAFVDAGAMVMMIGRNEAKTSAAASRIMSESGRRAIMWEIADLSRQDAVRDLAQRLRSRVPTIDILVNNAGAVFLDRAVTAEGLERTFALNHLNYFTLTLLLLNQISAAATKHSPARIINVSSGAHRAARLDLNDLQLVHGYGGWRAYANSKLCNVLFTHALVRRLDPSYVVAHAMHPGMVSTRMATNNGARGRFLRRMMDLVSISPEQGADTILWLATAADALTTSGDYWEKRKRVPPSASARDDVLADRVWRASETLAHIDADQLIVEAGILSAP